VPGGRGVVDTCATGAPEHQARAALAVRRRRVL